MPSRKERPQTFLLGSSMLKVSFRLESPHPFTPFSAGFCGRCFRSGVPSLCHHKSMAHSATLCVFDVRAAPAAVARFGTHHRRWGCGDLLGHFHCLLHISAVWQQQSCGAGTCALLEQRSLLGLLSRLAPEAAAQPLCVASDSMDELP